MSGDWSDAPRILARAVFPIALAVAAAGLLELCLLVVGRGRRIPLGALAPWTRPVLALLSLGFWFGILRMARPATEPEVSAGLSLILLALSVFVGRTTGRSVLVPLTLLCVACEIVWESGHLSPRIRIVSIVVNALLPTVAMLLALRVAPLGAADLRHLGSATWARDDLALAPLALVALACIAWAGMHGHAELFWLVDAALTHAQTHPYLGLPAAAFTVGAVFRIASYRRPAG